VYVTYGIAVFGVAVAVLCIIGLCSERRSPVYFDHGGDKLMLPPGKQALPPPGAPQIGRSRRPALPGPKK
jgi:hypothetical protein